MITSSPQRGNRQPSGKRIRILYVQRYGGGGSMVSLLELVRALDGDSIEPFIYLRQPSANTADLEAAGATVIHGYAPAKGLLEEAPAGKRPGGNLSLLRPHAPSVLRREFSKVARSDLPDTRRLLRVIWAIRPDIVHANSEPASDRYALIAARLTRTPLVVHVRVISTDGESLRQRIDRKLANHADHLIFVSNAAASSAKGRLPVTDSNHSIIYNPIDIGSFASAERSEDLRSSLGLPTEARFVLNIGRIRQAKDQATFLRAMVRCMADSNIYAVLAGEAVTQEESAYERHLRSLTSELGISDRVVFAGRRDDMATLIANSEIVVHTSLMESFGRAVAESMAGGKATIATNVGGVPEIISHGESGILIDPGDAQAAALAIERLLNQPDYAQSLGRAGQVSVAERFSAHRHAEELNKVYRDVLELYGRWR